MKQYLIALTLTGAVGLATAQTTFDFTAGTTSGSGKSQTWSQTVDGITCSVSYRSDGYGDPLEDLYSDEGPTEFVDSTFGLWMGVSIRPSTSSSRTSFHRPGATITFSHDVRLKGYTLGLEPHGGGLDSFCYLIGGNVTALAHYIDNTDHTGERPFLLEAVIPANTPLISCAMGDNSRYAWRFTTLTVEPESYVEPVVDIPAGNETGVTRVSMVGTDNKLGFVIKNGHLLAWGNPFLSKFCRFNGAYNGVLDFWVREDSADWLLLVETVEGFAFFESTNNESEIYDLIPLVGNIPAGPDQLFINESGTILALKEGQLYYDGALNEEYRDNMPAEIALGGVSEIALANDTALAVKEGQLYVWGGEVDPFVASLRNTPLPDAVANGEVLHLAADRRSAVFQLTNGELIPWYAGIRFTPSAAQTAGTELFTDLILVEETLLALRENGSFYVNEGYRGSGSSRYSVGYRGAFYEDQEGSSDDFNLKGLEIPPAIVQQFGFDQIAPANENIIATLPSGRVVVWGATDLGPFASNSANPISADGVPPQINEILFPQTNLVWGSAAQTSAAPSAAELSMLQQGSLGIQWGSDPLYEVETTTNLVSGEWSPLPTEANQRLYRIRETTP
jgi:hypothetical protein